MAHLLLLTNTLAPSAEVLPSLSLLSHHVHILPAEPATLVDSPSADVVLVDARRELAAGRSLCRMLRATGISVPLMAILTEGGLAGLTAEWGVDDVLLETAGPAEVEARLRLAIGSLALSGDDDPHEQVTQTTGGYCLPALGTWTTTGRPGSVTSPPPLTHEGDGTILSGFVVDQVELHGLLTTIRDLGVSLISVEVIDPTDGRNIRKRAEPRASCSFVPEASVAIAWG